MSFVAEQHPEAWDRIQRGALTVGIVGVAGCLSGLIFKRNDVFHSYLIGYLFWLGIALGCLPVVMLYHLVGGAWGFLIRRLLESATRTLPLLALLFLPVLFGMRNLYGWTNPNSVAGDPLLQHKSPYLNVPFFILRAVIYFVSWIVIAFILNRWSAEQDETGEPRLMRRFQLLSAIGLIVYGITMTFAATDWGMSLEAQWYSTIYGMLFLVSQTLSGLAFAIAVVVWIGDRPPISQAISRKALQDLGNLLLTFVMLWAYISFSQFLIIWSGNLPEEISWYMSRMRNGWLWVATLLLLFHFVVPFLLLLSRRNKNHAAIISRIAGAIIVMRFVDTIWVISPAFSPDHVAFGLLDVVALLTIGGFWVAAFIRQLKLMPLLALQDPNAAPGEG